MHVWQVQVMCSYHMHNSCYNQPSLSYRYGEIVNINLVRDRKSGKPKGFCFLAYEDQRSTVLAVDNLNGFKVVRYK